MELNIHLFSYIICHRTDKQKDMCKLWKIELKKLDISNIILSISEHLFENNFIPSPSHSVSGKTAAELMFGRTARTAFHLVLLWKPKIQQPMKICNLHELVFVKNFGKGQKWLKEIIVKFLEIPCVLVHRCGEIMCKCHFNQLRHRTEVSHEI